MRDRLGGPGAPPPPPAPLGPAPAPPAPPVAAALVAAAPPEAGPPPPGSSSDPQPTASSTQAATDAAARHRASGARVDRCSARPSFDGGKGAPDIEHVYCSHGAASTRDGDVWDQATREVYTVAAFRKARVETWRGELPDAQRHCSIHYYATGDGRHRAITLGLQKLGLPDLVLQDVPTRSATPAAALLNVLAQLLVEGAAIGPGGRVVVDLTSIAHGGVRERADSDLVGTPPRRATVDLVVAQGEEGDPDNRILGVRFASHQGATEVERLTAALHALFGSEDDATVRPSDDPELAAVTRRVQDKLPALAAAFRKGLPLNDRFSVKGPFDTDDGSVEWMWISVTAWPGEVLVGNLDNDPYSIASLKAGARVEMKQSAVADYLWLKADGSQEGGESVPILRRRAKGTP